MPQHKSCKKRMKTNAKAEVRNKAAKSALRKAIRDYRALAVEDKPAAYAQIQSALDVAARKRFIPANRAARLKSRLAPEQ